MATYYVSGVWKNAKKDIIHLNVHLTDDNTVYKATKMTEKEVIGLISKGHEIYTCNWNYAGQYYSEGAIIQVVEGYLRSRHNHKLSDNLDNMLLMDHLGA